MPALQSHEGCKDTRRMAALSSKKYPWSKWFWDAWESDQGLRQCSFAAQGLWMRMLCICAKGEPRGYLTIAGEPLDVDGVSTNVGHPETEVAPLLEELERWGVFSRDRKGRIYNRRIVRDEKKSVHARKIGKTGGNPTLLKQRDISAQDNLTDNGSVKLKKLEARNQKERSPPLPPAGEGEKLDELVAIWREVCVPPLLDIRSLNQTRRRTLTKRLKEDFGDDVDQWRAFCQRVKASPHLTGANDRNWTASFDWVLKPANLNKILEGNYDNRKSRAPEWN